MPKGSLFCNIVATHEIIKYQGGKGRVERQEAKIIPEHKQMAQEPCKGNLSFRA